MSFAAWGRLELTERTYPPLCAAASQRLGLGLVVLGKTVDSHCGPTGTQEGDK